MTLNSGHSWPMHNPSVGVGVVAIFYWRSQLVHFWALEGLTGSSSRTSHEFTDNIMRAHTKPLAPILWSFLSPARGLCYVGSIRPAKPQSPPCPRMRWAQLEWPPITISL